MNGKSITFDQKKDFIIKKYFIKSAKIINAWYDIEDNDEDISTERLVALVSDRTGVSIDGIFDTMAAFSGKFDREFPELPPETKESK